MFGYININQPEIKFKDYYRFRACYCGLCRDLKARHGQIARLSLGFDMTFLVVLLSGLYDTETRAEHFRCAAHPFVKRSSRRNEFTEYAADMNIILTYYKCMDDWKDERRWTRRLYGWLISRKAKKAAELYPEKAEAIRKWLEEEGRFQESCGQAQTDIGPAFAEAEQASSYFGHVMEEVFDCRQDMWSDKLRRMGFFLGKYIYLLDAYDDLEKDISHDSYNPFKGIYTHDSFHEKTGELLKNAVGMAAEAFEMLPVDDNMDILRNIIYSGVWRRFEEIHNKRIGQPEAEED